MARLTTRRQEDQAVLDPSDTLDAVTFIVPDKIDDSDTHGNIANSGGTANSGGKPAANVLCKAATAATVTAKLQIKLTAIHQSIYRADLFREALFLDQRQRADGLTWACMPTSWHGTTNLNPLSAHACTHPV